MKDFILGGHIPLNLMETCAEHVFMLLMHVVVTFSELAIFESVLWVRPSLVLVWPADYYNYTLN